MIPLRDQEVIRQRFEQDLKGPVKIDFFTQRPTAVFVPGREPCELCAETGQLLEEVAHLSPQIELRVHELGADRPLEQRYGIDKVPAIVVRGVVNRPVLFFGLPAAGLFPVLIESIVDASGPPPEPAPAVKRRLKRLKRPVRLQVFVLPAAPYCAEMARLAQELAIAAQHLRAEIIEVSQFPRLAEQHGIRAVPTTIIDGKVTLTGMLEPEALVGQAVRAAEHQTVPARSPLLSASASQTSTPLPAPPAQERAGAVRPSGLIIPGRS